METYEQQVQRLLRGQTAPFVGGVRVVLSRCDHCGRPRIMHGPKEQLDLSAEEVAPWADLLPAEIAEQPQDSGRTSLET